MAVDGFARALALANGGGASVDLSNYYTKEEADATNTETFYTTLYSAPSIEFMQTVVDALKKGTKVIIKDKGGSYGNYRERSLYGPDPNSIDWETYEGKINFISDWWLTGYSNPHRNYQVSMEPKWRTLVIRVTAGGVVTRIDSFNYDTHNNIINVVHELPVLGLKNELEYTPTKDYHPATKKYAEDASLNTIINHMSAEEFVYHDTNSIPETTYEISKLGTNDYEFILDETTGYYTSNNKGVHNSYALSKVNITTDKPTRIKVTYINYSYSYYDYGMFSNLDTELTDSATADSENVFKSTKSSSMSNAVREFYLDIPAGEHFFTVKYIKDGNTNYYDDTLQFKVETVCELITSTIASKKYVDDSIATLNTGESDLSNYYTKEEVEALHDDATVIEMYVEGTRSDITINSTENQEKILNYLNAYLQTGKVKPLFVLYNTHENNPIAGSMSNRYYAPVFIYDSLNNLSSNSAIELYLPGMFISNSYSNYYGIVYHAQTQIRIRITYSFNDEKTEITTCSLGWSGNKVLLTKEDSAKSYALGTKNTTAYTPTEDYNPATKKYVDDSIAAVGTGGSGDLTNYYTKEEVNALIAELRAEFLEVNTQLEDIINGGE